MITMALFVRRLSDKAAILSVLEKDRLYAAYAVGDLQAGLFEQCQWAVAEGANGPVALVMTFAGLQPPVLFAMGEAGGVSAILQYGIGPGHAYITVRPEVLQSVAQSYRLDQPQQMWRMAVDRTSFRPVAGPTVRLEPADVGALNELYAWGPAGFFSGYQLERGVYYAVAEGNRLVAVAGTHIVAPEYSIAAVGNVFTHPDFRGRGYAAACTSAVVADLLDMGCPTVVLNVRQDNAAAVRAYDKLGFWIHCPFVEMAGRRRGGVAALVHRLLELRER